MENVAFGFFHSRYSIVSDCKLPKKWLAKILPPDSDSGASNSLKGEFFISTQGPAESHGLYWKGEKICGFTGFDEENALGFSAMIQATLASESLPGQLFIHAGAVAIDGKGLVFPATTRAGKSTLTRSLVEAGCTYYSDDCAVLDREGNLHAYRSPMKSRESGENLPIHSFQEATGYKPRGVKIHLLAFTHFEPGVVFSPTQITQSRGIWLLLENLFYPSAIRRFPEETMDILLKATTDSRIIGGIRGESDDAAAVLLEFLRS